MTADLQAQLTEARDDLANAVCTCGHRAEWHSALIGCNAEDYTADAKPCDCRCDWLDAIMPTLAALVSAHVAQVREGLADEIEAQIIPFDQRGTGSKREIAAAHNDGCRKSARIVRSSAQEPPCVDDLCPMHSTDPMHAAVRGNRRALDLPPQPCVWLDAARIVRPSVGPREQRSDFPSSAKSEGHTDSQSRIGAGGGS